MTTTIINKPNFLHRLKSATKDLGIDLVAMSDLSRRKFLQIAAATSRLALSPQTLIQKALHEAPINPMSWLNDYYDASFIFINARQEAIAALKEASNTQDAESIIARKLTLVRKNLRSKITQL